MPPFSVISKFRTPGSNTPQNYVRKCVKIHNAAWREDCENCSRAETESSDADTQNLRKTAWPSYSSVMQKTYCRLGQRSSWHGQVRSNRLICEVCKRFRSQISWIVKPLPKKPSSTKGSHISNDRSYKTKQNSLGNHQYSVGCFSTLVLSSVESILDRTCDMKV